jgi:atypical dual specificity phosphatase
MAGVSRSTSIVISYIMVVTDLSWFDAMNAVRGARKVTNPNLGFQKQLYNFGQKNVNKVSLFFNFKVI